MFVYYLSPIGLWEEHKQPRIWHPSFLPSILNFFFSVPSLIDLYQISCPVSFRISLDRLVTEIPVVAQS